VADAAAVGKALSAIFQTEGEKAAQAGQSHQVLSEQPLHARVMVVTEPRTNTLLVTAPPAAMTVVEGIITDLESSPASEAPTRSPTTGRIPSPSPRPRSRSR